MQWVMYSPILFQELHSLYVHCLCQSQLLHYLLRVQSISHLLLSEITE